MEAAHFLHSNAPRMLPSLDTSKLADYVDLVTMQSAVLEPAWKANDHEFTRESMLISGFLAEKFAKGGKDYLQYDDHRKIVADFLSAHHGTYMVLPQILNTEIRGLRGAFEFREGSQVGIDDNLPLGQYTTMLTQRWVTLARTGIRMNRKSPEEIRRAFAWGMHDALLCIKPFEKGNGRVARVLLLDLRRRLDLPPILIRNEDGVFHSRRIRYFRENLFLPYMRKLGYVQG